MTVPLEQEVMAQMGLKGLRRCVEAVSDLLIAQGFEDVAKELRARFDEQEGWDDDEQ